MKLILARNFGRRIGGILVSKKELEKLIKKVDYIKIHDDDDVYVESLKKKEVAGIIVGNIIRLIDDLNLYSKLDIKDVAEIKRHIDEIDEKEGCEFLSKDILSIQYGREFGFDKAIRFLKLGYKVARKGWNGKGMFIFLAPKEFNRRIEDAASRWSDYSVDDFIVMATAQKTFQPGWLASQADMLADDWVIVKD